MEISKKELYKILIKQKKDFQRHTDILYEKFRIDIKTFGEGWNVTTQKVDALDQKFEASMQKLDATYEMIGEVKQDIEIIKQDISFIKQELKHKVDRDEFEALQI